MSTRSSINATRPLPRGYYWRLCATHVGLSVGLWCLSLKITHFTSGRDHVFLDGLFVAPLHGDDLIWFQLQSDPGRVCLLWLALQSFFFVRWKPILYWLFGPKNQSFRNKSGKTQPIRTKFGTGGHVKGWQRSGNFGRDRPILGKMGAETSPAEPEFFLFGKPRDLSATSQPQIFTKCGHET